MTTFAYKDGILAIDSRAVLHNWRDPFPTKKWRELECGTIAVGCGALGEIQKFMDWLESDRDPKERPHMEDSTVIEFAGSNQIMTHEAGGSFPYEGEFGAWGSGMSAAYAALMCGKSAKEAVQIAAQLDIYTGEPVYEIKIDEALKALLVRLKEEAIKQATADFPK